MTYVNRDNEDQCLDRSPSEQLASDAVIDPERHMDYSSGVTKYADWMQHAN
jgi:hypothetical protein